MTDPDLPSKLRALYVETGANYVQAAADEIERLRADARLGAFVRRTLVHEGNHGWHIRATFVDGAPSLESLDDALGDEEQR